MATLQYVLHIFLHIITWKILLQYVFAYVSSDYHFGEILPHTPCKKKVFFFSGMCCHMYLQMTSLCPTLLSKKKVFFFSGTFCHMCLQITSLCKSCTTLLAYVSLDDHFREILPHTPWARKYVLLLFRWLLYVNPAPHSMHMSLKMTTLGMHHTLCS